MSTAPAGTNNNLNGNEDSLDSNMQHLSIDLDDNILCEDRKDCLRRLLRNTSIDGSEPMQNDQTYFFSDIFLKFYNIIKM
jgi:hypothetical protein